MPFLGIMWASIFCIPFWLNLILLVKAGVFSMATIIFAGLVLSVLLLIFILLTTRKSIHDIQDHQLFIPATKVHPLDIMKMELKMFDNGGNRTGIDRRIFEYSACIPERRSGRDRRKGYDRRNSMGRRRESERRNVFKTPSSK